MGWIAAEIRGHGGDRLRRGGTGVRVVGGGWNMEFITLYVSHTGHTLTLCTLCIVVQWI